MAEENATQTTDRLGESIQSQISITFMDNVRIEAGEYLVHVTIPGDNAAAYSAIQLLKSDLEFANECLVEADKLGIPDESNLNSKALIFAGIVAYARAFVTSVRGVRILPSELIENGVAFDLTIHSYLMDLRNKHVAHSVNAFEECNTTGVLVGFPEKPTRPNGIGFVMKSSVGISRQQLIKALGHISTLVAHLETESKVRRIALFDEFKALHAAGNRMELAPIPTLNDRANVGNRR